MSNKNSYVIDSIDEAVNELVKLSEVKPDIIVSAALWSRFTDDVRRDLVQSVECRMLMDKWKVPYQDAFESFISTVNDPGLALTLFGEIMMHSKTATISQFIDMKKHVLQLWDRMDDDDKYRIVQNTIFTDLLDILKIPYQYYIVNTTESNEINKPTNDTEGDVKMETKDYPFDEAMEMVVANPMKLMFINNQTYDICMAAVLVNPFTIKYVKDQRLSICLTAIDIEPQAFEYVTQTPEICIEIVRRNGELLKYVKEQTPEICLAAVTNNGKALKYVKEQSIAICTAAVVNDSCSLKYVKNQTNEICLLAVIGDGMSLRYVEEQTHEICLAAVLTHKGAINFVRDVTPILAEAANTSWN